jgi:lysozyme
MTSPYLLGDLARDEGLRLHAYPDPISPRGRELAKNPVKRCAGWEKLSGAPWTIGYGHCGPEVHDGLSWSLDEANAALAKDADHAKALLDQHLPWWRRLSAYRQDVLVSMMFNMGWGGLSGFHNTLAAIEAADYERAAVGMLASKWATQTGDRAKRLATQMRTGVRAHG